MTIAKRIVQFDANFIGWIDIEDDAGAVHHYVKRGVIPTAGSVHVRWNGGQTIEVDAPLDGVVGERAFGPFDERADVCLVPNGVGAAR